MKSYYHPRFDIKARASLLFPFRLNPNNNEMLSRSLSVLKYDCVQTGFSCFFFWDSQTRVGEHFRTYSIFSHLYHLYLVHESMRYYMRDNVNIKAVYYSIYTFKSVYRQTLHSYRFKASRGTWLTNVCKPLVSTRELSVKVRVVY